MNSYDSGSKGIVMCWYSIDNVKTLNLNKLQYLGLQHFQISVGANCW